MSFVLDGILILIFAATIFTAAKKGFVKSLLEFAAVVAALLLAFSLSPIVSQTVYDSVIEEKIISSLEKQIEENLDADATASKVQVALDAMPDDVVEMAKAVGVDTDEIKDRIASQEFDSDNPAKEIAEKIAEPIAVGALTAVSFIMLALLLTVLLKLIGDLIAKLFNIPLVKSVNKALGAALGALRGIIIIVFLCTALRFLFSEGDGMLAEMINESKIAQLLENINPLLNLLK